VSNFGKYGGWTWVSTLCVHLSSVRMCKHVPDKCLAVVVVISAAAFVSAFVTLAYGFTSVVQALLCAIMLLQIGICWYTFMLESVVSTINIEARAQEDEGEDGSPI